MAEAGKIGVVTRWTAAGWGPGVAVGLGVAWEEKVLEIFSRVEVAG